MFHIIQQDTGDWIGSSDLSSMLSYLWTMGHKVPSFKEVKSFIDNGAEYMFFKSFDTVFAVKRLS